MNPKNETTTTIRSKATSAALGVLMLTGVAGGLAIGSGVASAGGCVPSASLVTIHKATPAGKPLSGAVFTIADSAAGSAAGDSKAITGIYPADRAGEFVRSANSFPTDPKISAAKAAAAPAIKAAQAAQAKMFAAYDQAYKAKNAADTANATAQAQIRPNQDASDAAADAALANVVNDPSATQAQLDAAQAAHDKSIADDAAAAKAAQAKVAAASKESLRVADDLSREFDSPAPTASIVPVVNSALKAYAGVDAVAKAAQAKVDAAVAAHPIPFVGQGTPIKTVTTDETGTAAFSVQSDCGIAAEDSVLITETKAPLGFKLAAPVTMHLGSQGKVWTGPGVATDSVIGVYNFATDDMASYVVNAQVKITDQAVPVVIKVPVKTAPSTPAPTKTQAPPTAIAAGTGTPSDPARGGLLAAGIAALLGAAGLVGFRRRRPATHTHN